MPLLNHFNFKQLNNNEFFITNDFGAYAFINQKEFALLVSNHIDKDTSFYNKMHDKGFLLEPMEIYFQETSDRLRGMKRYLLEGTGLHIFVMTNQCNLKCIYCQAQDHLAMQKGMMSIEAGRKSIDIALQSPHKHLTFEFQGGEPLLNFNVIRQMIEYAEQVKGDKQICYTLVSNLSLLTEEMAEFLLFHKVSICTSLDGPESIHAKNRLAFGKTNSYKAMLRGCKILRKYGFNPNAIQTTTRNSLGHDKDIIDEYVKKGQNSIFIRPLTPLGFAKSDWKNIGYTPEEFIEFYRKALRIIIDLNLNGTRFIEQHAKFFLRKIHRGIADNYMELRSPCGAALGQLAYYYDGDVYTCDEARMVAEAGNPAFKLGNVFKDDYETLLSSRICKATVEASVLESLPSCCDCVYQPYCGVCPVIQYALHGNIFPQQPHGYRCMIYKGILDCLFDILRNGSEMEKQVLWSWTEEHHENTED